MVFTPDMKQSYEKDGYLVVESLFTEEELAGVRQQIDALIADPDSAPEGVTVGREGDTTPETKGTGAVRGAAFMVRFVPYFQDFARTPKLLECVRGLLGPRVKVFRDQMLLKPPGGQAKPLHQDQSYFQVTPEDDLVTAWIALDDATIENGCMHLLPGQHTRGALRHHHTIDCEILSDRIEPELAVPIELKAGGVLYFSAMLPHQTPPNSSSLQRRALQFQYRGIDTVQVSKEEFGKVFAEADGEPASCALAYENG